MRTRNRTDRRSTRTATKAAGACAGAAILVAATAVPGFADNMAPAVPSSSGGQCETAVFRTDNAFTAVRYGAGMGAGSPMRAAADLALGQSYEPSDLDMSVGTSTADIQDVTNVIETVRCGFIWIPTLGGDLQGLVECKLVNTSSRCDKSEVHFDAGNTLLMTPDRKQSLACHEFGHGVGLEHRFTNATCMNSGPGSGGRSSGVETAHEWLAPGMINTVY